MADQENDVFDADKVAEALRKMANEWKPSPSRMTLKEKLGQPQILAAIKEWKRKGANNVEVVEGLAKLGIKTTPQSLNSTLGTIEREARGEGNAKSKRERKAKQTSTSSGTSAAASGGTTSEAPKPTGEKSDGKPPATGDAKPDAKPEGRKLTSPPSMGGAFKPDEL
ncbi:hypothetical protein [Agrobacterium radiobacter]|uniref:hypothetical protein n=1 Tax=Agrobacterium radiobacter TaxID=362 RepID=UPI003CE5AC36